MPEDMRLVQTFTATDSGGTSYEIYVFQRFIEDPAAGGPTFVPGPVLTTASRDRIDRISRGVYEIVRPLGNVRVTSTDPAAP